MKGQQQITPIQLSMLFFIFLTGSAVIVIPAPLIGNAGNGAWLSLLLSFIGAIALLATVLSLHKMHPRLTFIEYSRSLVGKWLTVLIGIPFAFTQLNSTAGIVLDIGLFMTSSMLRETPLYLFNLIIFIAVAFTARGGIELFARMFPMLIITSILFITVILLLAAGHYDIEFLLPVMPDGIKPILRGTYFSFLGFPYSELVIFSMLLPFVSNQDYVSVKKGMVSALTFNGIYLVAVTICALLVFGPIAGDRPYSTYEVARVTRFDILIGYSLITTSYMKAVITFYILYMTIVHLLKVKDPNVLIFPLALICFLFSLIQLSLGHARWGEHVTVAEPLLKLCSYIIPLIFIAIIAYFKKNKKRAAAT
ncbi:GerAB/ArcD/ProY family transporter [Halalkalibacterium halodurans]|uniref:GerAB/ArcD/ProY family transporter n=1 Tax=Halalkalibacterium halodurans TaxID=86665 RepID=UPI002AA971BE|nr:endospore germination permease [Halalkalibacterium halodurans]MDY7221637.1 endospore germination permease [Halalkalibacterium halodurans]MDY7240913.1 endospore germination permease [Halalkalibacterium halodurans]